MKIIIKYFLWVSCVLVVLIVFYLLAAIFLPMISVNRITNTKPDVEIYILTNGVHTDIVCPVITEHINWSEFVPFSDVKANQEFKYIAFGWGDKGFYLDTPEWKDLKASTAIKAAFWLGDSAMHTTFYNSMIEDATCKRLTLSRADYEQLIAYIQNSFELDQAGKVKVIKTDAVYGATDAFYEANGSYSLFYSCNTWASDALKVSNQKTALWTVTQQGIFRHYKK